MINFTKVGLVHTQGREADFEKAFAALPWKPTEEVGKVGFSQGCLIDEVLKQLPGGRITHYAEAATMAPFNLVGIQRVFKDCNVRIFILDEGSQATVLATEPLPA